MKNLKFMRLDPKAILPTRGSRDACGLDIYSIEKRIINSGKRIAIKTGLAVQVPSGHYGRVAPRSGIALRSGVDVLAGVIDSDYRGEVLCLLINLGDSDFEINVGDRIAQLIIEKIAILNPCWEEQLASSSRGSSGFGSTGS